MKLSLSISNQQDFYSELEEKLGASITSDGFESCLEMPPQIGKGKTRTFHFASGLKLYVQENFTNESISLETELNYLSLVMSWIVRGNANFALGNRDFHFAPGNHLLCYFKDIDGRLELAANEPVVMVDLALESYSPLYSAIAQYEYFPTPIKNLLLGKQTGYIRQELPCTLEMKLVLHQIVNCPYQGITKQLYLESKAIELLSLNLAILKADYNKKSQSDCGASRRHRFKPDEIERLYQAKTILKDNIDCPPSLNALARQVGLNEFKLKQGFRLLFDTTVFGYLHEYRMERSRLMLESGTFNVTEVAQTVGYANMSHFAAAVRKKFGVNPSQYRKCS
ncbi:MAG: helix-turn-helix transcriptional regulator [Pleurocapsa sp.]